MPIVVDAWAVLGGAVLALAVDEVFLLALIPLFPAVWIVGFGDALSLNVGWLAIAGIVGGGLGRVGLRRLRSPELGAARMRTFLARRAQRRADAAAGSIAQTVPPAGSG